MSIANAAEAKRNPGSIVVNPETKADEWLVITESKRAVDEKGYVHSCGTDILGLTVLVSIHDGPFHLSGYGKVQKIPVPYCPTCELTPSGRGSIVPDQHPAIKVVPASPKT